MKIKDGSLSFFVLWLPYFILSRIVGVIICAAVMFAPIIIALETKYHWVAWFEIMAFPLGLSAFVFVIGYDDKRTDGEV